MATKPTLMAFAAAGAAVTMMLSGCSSSGPETKQIGESASFDLTAGEAKLPVEVSVTSLEAAPAEISEAYAGGDEIWFADIDFRYTGDAVDDPASLNILFSGIYSELANGDYLDTTFTGMEECNGPSGGSPTEIVEALAAGETVSGCFPLSSDGDNGVTGVYVGSSNLDEGGALWRP
ncbi:hypothetical protein BJY17_002531 [Agromyces hippuratus]|uniref:DUF4352 domain-containing protein n=1 Tax=Agromyces hippuratus TaxID=286438 RepID=A0A852X2U9_9MICO|nr:hypothetical protein [Agromyces hippuratus]NYG21784.1 hypothetical protein [Agromyces hippuratus]